MNYQLIILSNPILVSDEKIEEDDWYYSSQGILQSIKSYFEDERGLKTYHLTHELWSFKCHKIIAGLPELPQLDLSLVAGEIGYVDVEKLAEKANGYGVYGKGGDKYNAFNEGFKIGFNANPKKYTEEDLRNAIDKGYAFAKQSLYKSDGSLQPEIEKYIQSLQQPKVYNVEVEMNTWFKNGYDGRIVPTTPRITNNTIKVIKIL